MEKRILAILLTFAMLVSLVSTVALATEEEEDTVPASEILAAAAEYVYGDYNYTGNIATKGNMVYYTIEPTDIGDGSPIMNDLARFLGALWRFDEGKSAEKIIYDGVEYEWDTNGTEAHGVLNGSNWENNSDATLVSVITAAFKEQASGFAANGSTLIFKLNGKDVTVNLIPLTGLKATGTENVDYEWEDNSLIILKDGVTVSGATAKQSIVVAEGVTDLTLNGVTIAPTEYTDGIDIAILSCSEALTIILMGNNRIGNTVNYTDATDDGDYFVKTGIDGPNLTFTGEGSLTIHDRNKGISSDGYVTFDGDFKGTLTIEDYGDEPKCAIAVGTLYDNEKDDFVGGDVSLLGGTFDITSYKSDGIHAFGNVTIDDATVTINSGRKKLDPGKGVGENGIYVESGNVTISGKADVAAGGKEYGIYVEEGNIVIGTDDADTVQVLADGYQGGIKTEKGNIDIKAGTVKARAHKWGIGVGTTEGVGGDGNITISGKNTNVVAFGGVENDEDYKYGCGIYAVGGSVTVKDGAGVIAKGYDYGIGAENNVLIQGTTTNVNAEGGYSGPEADTEFENNTGDDGIFAYGIFAKTGTIKVQGGTVEAHGCDGAFNETPVLTAYNVRGVITAAAVGGVDAATAEKIPAEEIAKESPTWATPSIVYAEIFSKTLKEKLSIDASEKVLIAGEEVTTAKLACYGIRYDKAHDTLTLDGLTQNLSGKEVDTADSVYAIKLPAGITIVLKGVNTITAPKTSASQKMAYGIFSSGALTIKGYDTAPGSLTISGGGSSAGVSYGIYAAGDLRIDDDPTITVNGGNGKKGYGIYSKGNATISSGTISAIGKTAAVAVDTGKTLTVGATAKTATLSNATADDKNISKSNGAVTGGVLTSTMTDDPVVISFKPVIVVTQKNGASFPAEGEVKTDYELYTVSAENFASDPSRALQWKNGDAWDGFAPKGVTLGTDGKITTTAKTVAGDYIFRITNNLADDAVGFVSSGEITLTITEAKAEGECTYEQKVCAPENGKTYQLKLNCKDVGEFTFTKNGSGWSIQNSDGKYLTMKDGKLVLSGTAFAWTYMNGAFSTTVKTIQKTSGHRILFIYIPGCTKTVTTTYYLSTVTNCAKLATDCTCAELYTTVSGDHDFGCRIDCKDGERHMRVCKYCGKAETEAHHFGEDGNADRCDKCGAFNPACKSVDVSATFKTKTQKQYVGFWPFGYYKNVTTYTATVKTTVTGAKVTKVEVSANQNKGWTVSNTFTSNSKIKQFYVRVTTDDGKTSLFMVCADGIGYPAN